MSKTNQRALIILRDLPDGTFTAELTFEPSIKGRKDTSPCIRAAWRLANLIVAQKEQLIAPMPGVKSAESERPPIIITDAVVL